MIVAEHSSLFEQYPLLVLFLAPIKYIRVFPRGSSDGESGKGTKHFANPSTTTDENNHFYEKASEWLFAEELTDFAVSWNSNKAHYFLKLYRKLALNLYCNALKSLDNSASDEALGASWSRNPTHTLFTYFMVIFKFDKYSA